LLELSRIVEFAADSPLERTGYEPSVPELMEHLSIQLREISEPQAAIDLKRTAAGDRMFESTSLQQRARCELRLPGQATPTAYASAATRQSWRAAKTGSRARDEQLRTEQLGEPERRNLPQNRQSEHALRPRWAIPLTVTAGTAVVSRRPSNRQHNRRVQPQQDQLVAMPQSSGIGETVLVRGDGLEPGRIYRLNWTRVVGNRTTGAGWQELSMVVADSKADGARRAEFRFVVPGDLGGVTACQHPPDDAPRSIAGGTLAGNYPSPRRSRTGTMLHIPNAINTATILSTRVHRRQSAFRSLITSSDHTRRKDRLESSAYICGIGTAEYPLSAK
jgi:hypothetical protein